MYNYEGMENQMNMGADMEDEMDYGMNPNMGAQMGAQMNPNMMPMHMNMMHCPMMNMQQMPMMTSPMNANHLPTAVSPEFLENLLKAIKGERGAIIYYEHLLRKVKDDEDRKIVNNALKEEMEHNRQLTNLYIRLTGREPSVKTGDVRVPERLTDAFKEAIKDELDAADLYKEMYLATRVPYIRDIFFNATNDEKEHAIGFTMLYAKYKS